MPESNARAFRAFSDILQRYGTPEPGKAALVFLPQRLEPDEWLEMSEKISAKQKRLIAEWEEKEAAGAVQCRKS